ncbi:Uncharacterised protein [Nocardia africana]|uniref:Core-binding (CB) domain-containing protein n=1 Tax=Nocardia africana TaxID=134964 RepID=A0A378WWK1_9NOCA|nr:Uncharacterised protein [Nocardia africana]
MRPAIDAFLDTPKVRAGTNTLRAGLHECADRVAEVIGPGHALNEITDTEIGEALTELWGAAQPATWNRNRAAVRSWLTWCSAKQRWTAPGLPTSAERRRENNDDIKAVSRSRTDRLCRRRDIPLREMTLWRMLYESASRASAVLALNMPFLAYSGHTPRRLASGRRRNGIHRCRGHADRAPRRGQRTAQRSHPGRRPRPGHCHRRWSRLRGQGPGLTATAKDRHAAQRTGPAKPAGCDCCCPYPRGPRHTGRHLSRDNYTCHTIRFGGIGDMIATGATKWLTRRTTRTALAVPGPRPGQNKPETWRPHLGLSNHSSSR